MSSHLSRVRVYGLSRRAPVLYAVAVAFVLGTWSGFAQAQPQTYQFEAGGEQLELFEGAPNPGANLMYGPNVTIPLDPVFTQYNTLPVGDPAAPGIVAGGFLDTAAGWDAKLNPGSLAPLGINQSLSTIFGAGTLIYGFEDFNAPNLDSGVFALPVFVPDAPAVNPMLPFYQGLTVLDPPYAQIVVGGGGLPDLGPAPIVWSWDIIPGQRVPIHRPGPIDWRFMTDDELGICQEAWDTYGRLMLSGEKLAIIEARVGTCDIDFRIAEQDLEVAKEATAQPDADIHVCQGDILTQQALIADLNSQLASAKADLAQAEADEERYRDQKQQILGALSEDPTNTILNSRLKEINRQILLAEQAQRDAKDRIAQLNTQIADANTRLGALQSQLTDAQDASDMAHHNLMNAQSTCDLAMEDLNHARQFQATAIAGTDALYDEYTGDCIPAASEAHAAAWGRSAQYDVCQGQIDSLEAERNRAAADYIVYDLLLKDACADIGTEISPGVQETLDLLAEEQSKKNIARVMQFGAEDVLDLDTEKSVAENIYIKANEEVAEKLVEEAAKEVLGKGITIVGKSTYTVVKFGIIWGKLGWIMLDDSVQLVADAVTIDATRRYLIAHLDPDPEPGASRDELPPDTLHNASVFVTQNPQLFTNWTGQEPPKTEVEIGGYLQDHKAVIAYGLSRHGNVVGQPVDPQNELNNALAEHYHHKRAESAYLHGLFGGAIDKKKDEQQESVQQLELPGWLTPDGVPIVSAEPDDRQTYL